MGRTFVVDDKDSIGWYSGKSVQIKTTGVRATQKCIGIVRHGDSSEDIDTQLSKIEDNGEEEYRSEILIAIFQRQTRENWKRSSGQQSEGTEWRWRREKVFVTSRKKKASVRKETNAVSGMRVTIVRKNQNTKPPPSEPSMSRGRSVSKKNSVRGKSNHGAILRQPCRYCLKGTCTRSPCENYHPPECQFTKQKRAAKPVISVCSRIIRLMSNQTKSQKKLLFPQEKKATTRMLWLLWKLYHNWVASRKTRKHWFLKEENSPGETRLKKSWDQFDEYDVQKLRSVTQTSEKQMTIAR